MTPPERNHPFFDQLLEDMEKTSKQLEKADKRLKNQMDEFHEWYEAWKSGHAICRKCGEHVLTGPDLDPGDEALCNQCI